jgi:hypothetical protein
MTPMFAPTVTLAGRQVPMRWRAPAVQAPQVPQVPAGLLSMVGDAGGDGGATGLPAGPAGSWGGGTPTGVSTGGATAGGLIGGLLGPAGMAIGTALGTQYDVDQTRQYAETLGLPGSTISYGPALAAAMSLGMFGEGLQGQLDRGLTERDTRSQNAYADAMAQAADMARGGDGGGLLGGGGPDMGGWGSGSGGLGDIGSAW